MRKENNVSICKFNSECLELIAGRFSLLYTFCILSSIIIGLILLGLNLEGKIIKFILGLIGIVLITILLVYKEKIEKIKGYYDLSGVFKNLERDLINKKNTKKSLNELKRLTKKLADYPIDRYTKWLVNRKFLKDNS